MLTVAASVVHPVPVLAANPYNWVSVSGDVSPIRSGPATSQDGTVSPAQVLLFGGQASSGPLNDTWRWDGTTWTKLSPTSSPSARTNASMVYDTLHNQVILFGGSGASGVLSDTWAWNGTTWTNVTPPASPSARSAASMVWDPLHQVVVLFGGATKTGVLQDTWIWNGSTWTQQAPSTSPTVRSAASAAWDPASQSVILFGGANKSRVLGDTWRWNGSTWAQLTMTTSPSARSGAAAGVDAASGLVTLFGGAGSTEDADTWTFNQTTWTSLSPTTSPTARDSAGFATAADGSLVLVDGESGSTQVAGTWIWQTAPGAPTNVTAVGQNRQAAVSWNAAPSGGQAITSYTVTASPGGATATSTTTSATVAGLQPATSYTFTVTATNALGTGAASAPSSAATTWSVPGTPGGVTASAGNGQATVSWTAPASDGGSAITAYTVTPYVGSTAQTPSSVGGSTTSTIVSGLTNGTTYTFQVTATNVVGTSAAGTSNAVMPVGAPTAPTNVTATPGNGQAIVSWTAPVSDGGSAITGYTVTPFVGSTAQSPTAVAATITSTTVGGLTNGTTYTFQVTATNAIGTSVPGTSPAVTPVGPPAAPASVSATGGNAQATVTWTAPTSDGGGTITSYTVTPYIGSTAQTATVVSGTTLSATITGLSNGSTYTFHVTATNSAGTGPAAVSNSVTLGLPGAPGSVSATAGANQASVSWTAPTDGTAPSVTAYLVTAYVNGAAVNAMATSASTTSVTISGLQAGVSYTFQVQADDQYGWGPSTGSSAVIPTGTSTTYASVVLSDGPVAYYRLDEPSGTIATDSSGYRNNGLYDQHVSWGGGQTPGGASGALANDPDRGASVYKGSIPGANIAVTATAGFPQGSAPRTWEAWFRSAGGVVAATMGSAFRVTLSGQYSLQVTTPGGTLTWMTPYVVNDSNWHMVDAVYDGVGNVTLYLDGASLGTKGGAGAAGTVTGLAISGDTNGSNPLLGAIDEVALYSSALNASQVGSHFAASGDTLPSSPTVTATAGSNQATVSWSAATAGIPSGEPQVIAYLVTAYANGTVAGTTATGGSTTSVTMSGLQGAASYTFQVKALNEFGWGTASASAAVVPSGAASTYVSTVLADGPAAYYRLDEPSGGYAADSSGNGNLALYDQYVNWGGGQTPGGATGALANDPDRAASVYKGSQPGANIAEPLSSSSLPQGASPRTWEGWFRSAAGVMAATMGSAFRVTLSGQYTIQVTTPGATLTWTAPYVVNDSNWHMVDAVYDGVGSVTLYLDGVSLGAQSGAGTAGTVTALAISGDTNGGNPLLGAIDEVALYSSALSAAQVAGHFTASGDSPPSSATVTASAGNNQATVSWTAASAGVPAGEPQVTAYLITAYANGAVAGTTAAGTSTTSVTMSGLPGGVGYTFQVKALNEFGWGPASTSAPVTPTGASSTYVSTVLGDAPAAYYRLDEPSGGYAADSSGNGNTALYDQHVNWGGGQTPGGATGALANDPDSAASVYKGSQPGANIALPLSSPTLPQGSSSRTWEGWFRSAGGTLAATVGSTFRVRLSGQYSMQVITPAATLTWTTPYVVNDSNWHMVDAVYDGVGNVTLYLDGASLGSQGGAGTAATVSALTMTGDTNGGDPLLGAADDIALYGSALSAGQVASHFMASGDSTPSAATVTATAGTNQATVSWTPATAGVPAGEPQVAAYLVTAYGNGTVAGTTATGGTTTSVTMSGLPGGVSYTFQVKALNEFGWGSASTSNAVGPSGASTTYVSTILADAPAAYYRLDEPSGGYAADSSGNGNTALYDQYVSWGGGQTPGGTSGALANDPDRAASVYKGSQPGANIALPLSSPTLPQGSTPRTWEGWFQGGTGTLAATMGTTFRVRVAGQYAIQVITPSATLTWATPYVVTDGNWHMVDAAYDGVGNVTVYLDGASLGVRSGAGTAAPVTALSMSGDTNGGDPLLGAVDDIALYGSALTGTQVTAHFAASGDTTPTAPGGLTATAGANQVTASWSASTAGVPLGASQVMAYEVTALLNGAPKNDMFLAGTATSVTVTGLEAGATYTIQVTPRNQFGQGAAAGSNQVIPTGTATTYVSTVLADLPVAYYRLDDTVGLAADSSGDGNLGLYDQNVSWGGGQTPSGAAGALVNDPDAATSVYKGSLPGANIAVSTGTGLPQGSSARTWEGWFKTSGAGTLAALAGTAFRVRVSSQNALQVVTPAATLTFTTPYPVTDGLWHLVHAVYDGSASVTVYLDGVSVGTQTGAGTAATATGLSLTGDVNGSDPLLGAVDEVALYDSALTADQVASHFAASGDTRPVPPGVPTNVSATGGNTQATVHWSPPTSSGTGPVTGYTITPYIGTTAQTPTSVGPSATSVTVTGLTNNVTYTFQVVAVSAYGSSVPATTNAVMPAVLPGAPTNVTAIPADALVTVRWTAPAPPGSTVGHYTVTPFAGSTALTNLAVTVSATNGNAVVTSAAVGGLTDGTTYTFQVTATNDTGTGPAGVSGQATPVPPAPITMVPPRGYDAGAAPGMVAVADVTGDGWPDLVTADGGANSVSALLNQVKGGGRAGGTFSQPATVSNGGVGVGQVVVGDVNGDGTPDAVVVNGSGTISVMIGTGNGAFGPASTVGTLNGVAASFVAVADLNGDGKLDVVTAGGVSAYPNGTALGVLLGNGDGTFQAPTQINIGDTCLGCGYWATGLLLADVTGDGRPDIVYTNDNTSHGWEAGNVYVLTNLGNGSFNPPQILAEVPGPKSATPGGDLAVTDLNGDSIADVVVLEDPQYVDLNGSGGERGVSIFFGRGGGSFAAPVYVSDPALVGSSNSQDYGDEEAVAIADMNGDGLPDIVTGDARNGNPGIGVYLNPGGGSIDSPQFIATGGFIPRDVALGDVNGDGESDVVIENGGAAGAPNVDVLINGTDFPPLGGALGPNEMHGCAMCQAMRGGGALDISGSHPITVNTGEMSHTFTDISIPARGYPLSVSQTYNDLAAGVDAGLGYGWWSPIFMSVSSDPSTGRTTVTQEDGGQAQFFTGSLQPVAPRTQATLAHNADGTWTFKRYSGDTFSFNSSGQIISVADRNGDSLSYGYTSGHVSSLSHSDGRSLAIAWSGSHVSSITDSNVAGTTRSVSFTYDSSSQLTDIDWKVNAANDRNEHFEYESSPWPHGMTGMRDPRGIWVTQVYDANGRTTSQTVDPTGKNPSGLNRTTTYAYTVNGSLVSQVLMTDPVGNQTLDTFAYGELIQKVEGYGSPNAATWGYSYDPSSAGTRLTTDPKGHISSASYDSYGNALATTDALSRTTSYTYGGNGGADAVNYQPTTMTDPNGVTTTYSYDPTHRTLTQVSTPLVGSSPAVSKVVQYVHGNTTHPGDITSMVDGDQKTWSYGYDTVGDRASVTDPMGDTSSTTYNADGWILTTVSPKGDPSVCTSPCAPAQYTTTYSYADGSGNVGFFGVPTVITDPLGHQTTRVYDNDNNVVQTVDGDGNITTYDYDDANELTITHRADAGHTTTATDYNADGTIHDQIDGKGNTLQSYGYNSLGQQITLTVDPGASGHLNQTTVYTSDALGNVLNKQDPGGSCTGTVSGCTTYAYDAGSQLTGITYSDGQTPNVSGVQYDADGQRIAMTDGTGQWSWQYDSLHRLSSVTEGGNGTVTYQYDLRGLVTQIGYPTSGHSVSRGYDDAGRWTSVQDWNGAATAFKYDRNSNLYETDMASGTTLVDGSTFNNADQLTSISNVAGTSTVFSATYGRDGNGQVTSDTSAPSAQSAYQYTGLNQLCYAGASNSAGCESPPSGAQAYAYDAADNPITVGSITQAFNSADQVTASGSTSFQYDTRGNRVSATTGASTTSYGYDQANRLCWTGPTSSSAACNATAQSGDTLYCYSGDGLRMTKVSAGSCAAPSSSEPYVWDVAAGLPQILTDSGTSYVQGPGGLPLEQISGSTTLWYHHDQLGSTRALTDGSGNVTATYTFDPYGNVSACTGATIQAGSTNICTGSVTNPFLYAGQYHDAEVGLYYFRARYYDSTTAQFLSRDPLTEATAQPYAYAANDPVNYVDSSGLWCRGATPFSSAGPEENDHSPGAVGGYPVYCGPSFNARPHSYVICNADGTCTLFQYGFECDTTVFRPADRPDAVMPWAGTPQRDAPRLYPWAGPPGLLNWVTGYYGSGCDIEGCDQQVPPPVDIPEPSHGPEDDPLERLLRQLEEDNE